MHTPSTRIPPREPLGIHVVQISYDETLAAGTAVSEAMERQATYARQLAKLLPGSQVTILLLTRDQNVGGQAVDNLAIRPILYRSWLTIPFVVRRALRSLHANDPIAVVTTQTTHEDGIGALLFRRQTRVPVIAQVHYDCFDRSARAHVLGGGLSGALRWQLSRSCYQRYDAIRVVARLTAAQLAERGWHTNIHVIPVPVALIAEAPIPRFAPTKAPQVLYVGRLAPEKRLDRWLRVARRIADRIPTARFDLVGDGPERPALEQLTHDLGLDERVHFHGFVPHDRLGPQYQNATVFLFTSEAEGFGRVLAEASAHGLPIVSSRVAGSRDIIEDGVSGYLLAGDDTEGMANRVIELAHDDERRRMFGTAGHARVLRDFSPDALVRQWVDLWRTVAKPDTRLPRSLLAPKRPTWKRWRRIAWSPHSLLRSLEYEVLRGLPLTGRTLDIGGGGRNSYSALFRTSGTIDSVNIAPVMQPTYLADLNQPLAIPDGTYDNVISFNTFEHIADDGTAIREALRVLKPGGRCYFLVPFLYKVHGSPNDYHRHTAWWWHDALTALGISEPTLSIDPLVWDPSSSGGALRNFGNRRWQKALALCRGPLRHGWNASERLPSYDCSDYALGYYLTGTKQ